MANITQRDIEMAHKLLDEIDRAPTGTEKKDAIENYSLFRRAMEAAVPMPAGGRVEEAMPPVHTSFGAGKIVDEALVPASIVFDGSNQGRVSKFIGNRARRTLMLQNTPEGNLIVPVRKGQNEIVMPGDEIHITEDRKIEVRRPVPGVGE